LQNDSQISGSSPSVYSYEGANASGINNQADSQSAPIAINLPAIKISNNSASSAVVTQFTNSDSEPYSSGSTSGSFSSDDSEILATVKKPTEVVNDSSLESNSSAGGTSMLKESGGKKSIKDFRAKNSVDSLSEDSGYCDRDIRSLPAGALSLDTSLPNGNDLEDEDGSAIEEKSILTQMRSFPQTLPRIRSHSDDDDDICYHSMESINRRFKSRKIEDSRVTHTLVPPIRHDDLKIDMPSVQRANEHSAMVKNKTENERREAAETHREKFISISSPELRASGDTSRASSARIKSRRGSSRSRNRVDDSEEQFTVSSLPDYLHLLGENSDEESALACDSIANKNFNLFDLNYGANGGKSSCGKKIVDISASCANLTLLNYSDDCCYDSHRLLPINNRSAQKKVKTMSGKFPYHSEEEEDDDEDDYIANYRSKELTSLLEEISAHFNKNLSILNDREASYEPQTDVRDGKSSVSEAAKKAESPPKPPPRARTQIKTSANHLAGKSRQSFDRDPTNLSTTYAQSLEKCNFNVDEPVTVYSSRQNVYLSEEEEKMTDDLQKASAHKRNFVSSTPNLNYFDFEMKHVQHYSSIDNAASSLSTTNGHLSPSFAERNDENRCTSMKEIPSSHSRASSTGILASHSTGGSRSGLSVSFCPIVSEISWQVSVDDDDISDDVDMDPSAGDNYSGTRNDSLVNYYNDTHENDDDDDDDEEDFDDFRAVGTSTAPTQTHAVIDDRASTQTSEKTLDRHECSIETLTLACEETTTQSAERASEESTAGSNKMLVESQTPSEKFIRVESQSAAPISSQTMTTVPPSLVGGLSEKPSKSSSKQKKSIFSRLSSGFRFSFRGKKNKKLVNDGVVHYPIETNNNSKQQVQSASDNRVCGGAKSTDFIFIPLSDPPANHMRHFNSQNDKLASELHEKLHNAEASIIPTLPPPPAQQQQQQQQEFYPPQNDRQSRPIKPARESPPKGAQVMGKPPLPKQPPRIVGTTQKRASAHPPRASSTPREYDNGEFYHQHNMVGDGLKQQYYSERARTMDGGHKIGLIETNLDTDETIINGKTQSLMELGIGLSGGRGNVMNRLAGMGGVKVMNQDSSENQTGGNRPHKSMEFLLDKENHHCILVSCC
jgi:hypothetical protein